MTSTRLAGIDIGTLTCRLLIADLASHGQLKELCADRRILRLGEGVDQNNCLTREAMDRVLACLREWRDVIDGYHVDARTVVATSAVRDAENRREFLDRVLSETGFEVEILTGDEEARRTILGVRSTLPCEIAAVLAVDIGGGSTEFIFDRPGQPPVVRSIDIGVVRLCERLLRHDPPTIEEIQQAREWVRRETQAVAAGMPGSVERTFVGTAGTITSLAAMAQQLPTYEPANIQNYRLTLVTIVGLEQQLLASSRAARVGLPGLERNREDVIAAGVLMLRTIMEALGEQVCLVSDSGLREGVLLHLARPTRSSS